MSFSYNRETFKEDCTEAFEALRNALPTSYKVSLKFAWNSTDSDERKWKMWLTYWAQTWEADITCALYNHHDEYADRDTAKREVALSMLHEFMHVLCADSLSAIDKISTPCGDIFREKLANIPEITIKRVLSDEKCATLLLPHKPQGTVEQGMPTMVVHVPRKPAPKRKKRK